MNIITNQSKLILNYHLEGKTVNEISILTGVKNTIIVSAINRRGYKANKYKLLTVEEEKEIEQIILGSVFGDGYLSKTKGGHLSNLHINHSDKQDEYITWKYNLLKKYDLVTQLRKWKSFDNRFKKGFSEGLVFKSKTHPIFSKYRNIFYINDIKKLNKEYVEKMDELALAIWFFDDSSKCKSGYQIQTRCFSKEEIQLLIDHLLNKFNIESNFQPHANILYIKANSVKTLDDILNKYCLESMKYKLHNK